MLDEFNKLSQLMSRPTNPILEKYASFSWFSNTPHIFPRDASLDPTSMLPERVGRGTLLIDTTNTLVYLPVWLSLQVSEFWREGLLQCQVLFEFWEEVIMPELRQEPLNQLHLVDVDEAFNSFCPTKPTYYAGLYLNESPCEFSWFLRKINGGYHRTGVHVQQTLVQVEFSFELAVKLPQDVHEQFKMLLKDKQDAEIVKLIRTAHAKLEDLVRGEYHAKTC